MQSNHQIINQTPIIIPPKSEYINLTLLVNPLQLSGRLQVQGVVTWFETSRRRMIERRKKEEAKEEEGERKRSHKKRRKK